ncbi:E3 ubiquitin-protein ligase RGLG1 [Carex littledalei]|uniref:E3 ubiquitin-protein ligase RGLG1 n=1 Tax=Carex littledalei TaxID=544730 RepID=A0A833VY88_9POAL|nr:E3 ubiquitin-protein ligase RGLG1 [Carex littledalei]
MQPHMTTQCLAFSLISGLACGFEEVLSRYRFMVPHLNLSGPTSFAPVINAAISIVESSWQYHVLVIIADGQVTRTNVPAGKLSPQEEATIDAIVTASHYPLSIVMVGIGDGPWDSMQHFDDCIPERAFDNFQFVNFTDIMKSQTEMSKKEAAFALAALMEIPLQYTATQKLYAPEQHGRDRIGAINILPPPRAVVELDNAANAPPAREITGKSTDDSVSTEQVCPICLTNPKDMAFQCGHLVHFLS